MSEEIPVRFPPPVGIPFKVVDGMRVPSTQKPIIECGHRVHLRGVLVECIRPAGHPVAINFGHSNGYDEWCFDEVITDTPN